MMTEKEKREFISQLDEDLLKGGVMLSEWSAWLVRDADIAFTSGANIATLLTALAGIESHLKYEYGAHKRERLVNLINNAPIDDSLRQDLHRLRKYRNQWVHVDDPSDDETLFSDFSKNERELEDMALLAITAMRRTLYVEQCV